MNRKKSEWREKTCSTCGKPFQPDGGRRTVCPGCRGSAVAEPSVGQGFLAAWNKKKERGLWSNQSEKARAQAAVAVAVAPADEEKAENNEEFDDTLRGGRSFTHKTCIDCRRVPEGKFCTDRCLK